MHVLCAAGEWTVDTSLDGGCSPGDGWQYGRDFVEVWLTTAGNGPHPFYRRVVNLAGAGRARIQAAYNAGDERSRRCGKLSVTYVELSRI
jgi:hypothetical protein